MTIKKPMKTAATAADAAAPAAGGATIANRFKLDMTEPAAKKPAAGSSTATTVAGIAGIVALIVAGILTYIIYQHWEFLMPA